MPAALLHFSSLRRSQHNYVRAMPALKFQQNLRQNRQEDHRCFAAKILPSGKSGADLDRPRSSAGLDEGRIGERSV